MWFVKAGWIFGGEQRWTYKTQWYLPSLHYARPFGTGAYCASDTFVYCELLGTSQRPEGVKVDVDLP